MTHSVFHRMLANEPAACGHPKLQEFSFYAETMDEACEFLVCAGAHIQYARIERAFGHVDVSFTSGARDWNHFYGIAKPWRMIRDTLSLDSEET